MMRVLHFYKTYYPDTVGGVEQSINQLALASEEFGIETQVLTLADDPVPPTILVNNHRVHRTRTNFQIASTNFSASAFLKFHQIAQKVDIIHYHFPWPLMDLVHLTKFIKKPTVLTYHSDIVRQKFLLRIYFLLRNCFLSSVDRLITTSPNYYNSSPVLEKYHHKTSIIPIGLDKSTYQKPSQFTLKKWQNKIPGQFFLFVGQLRYYKGLHILLEAAQNKDYPIVIAGGGPLENELKALATKLKLKNVYFVGALPEEDKIALFNLCYAVVFPSHLRAEAFGISLLEGAMYGKPMISTEINSGTSYINEHEVTGFVVEPSNPHAFSKAMDNLWQNPELAKKMGENAEARYWNLFTAKKMAEQHFNLYQELINQRNKQP